MRTACAGTSPLHASRLRIGMCVRCMTPVERALRLSRATYSVPQCTAKPAIRAVLSFSDPGTRRQSMAATAVPAGHWTAHNKHIQNYEHTAQTHTTNSAEDCVLWVPACHPPSCMCCMPHATARTRTASAHSSAATLYPPLMGFTRFAISGGKFPNTAASEKLPCSYST